MGKMWNFSISVNVGVTCKANKITNANFGGRSPPYAALRCRISRNPHNRITTAVRKTDNLPPNWKNGMSRRISEEGLLSIIGTKIKTAISMTIKERSAKTTERCLFPSLTSVIQKMQRYGIAINSISHIARNISLTCGVKAWELCSMRLLKSPIIRPAIVVRIIMCWMPN